MDLYVPDAGRKVSMQQWRHVHCRPILTTNKVRICHWCSIKHVIQHNRLYLHKQARTHIPKKHTHPLFSKGVCSPDHPPFLVGSGILIAHCRTVRGMSRRLSNSPIRRILSGSKPSISAASIATFSRSRVGIFVFNDERITAMSLIVNL